MASFLITLALGCILFLSVSMQKAYHNLPLKELKRRARAGDDYAATLYKVASYGVGVDVLMWIFIGLSSALLFIKLADGLSWWTALPLVLIITLLAFAWLPAVRVGRVSSRSATIFAPVISKLLSWLQPINSRLAILLKRIRPIRVHTGLYEKEDLLELLDKQHTQIDNRISEKELVIARGSLSFGDKLIREIMTPKRVVKTVDINEPISPYTMDELHTSGFSRFPVVDKSSGTEQIVGTLYLRELVGTKYGGNVVDLMKPEVYYVNEEKSLLHALDAFIKTKHHLFIVVNSFEEVVGVVSFEDVIEQVLGSEIVDEFDQFDDLRAVASLAADEDRKQNIHPD